MSKSSKQFAPDFSTNEWLFQISTLDKSLEFIDRSWCLLVGNGAPQPLIADNENTLDAPNTELDFRREETPHVLREAREALTALRTLSMNQDPASEK